MVMGAAVVSLHVEPANSVPNRINVVANCTPCVVPPEGYHAGRVQAPVCITQGPFWLPVVCVVANTIVMPTVPATPSIVCAPERVRLVFPIKAAEGLTEGD